MQSPRVCLSIVVSFQRRVSVYLDLLTQRLLRFRWFVQSKLTEIKESKKERCCSSRGVTSLSPYMLRPFIHSTSSCFCAALTTYIFICKLTFFNIFKLVKNLPLFCFVLKLLSWIWIVLCRATSEFRILSLHFFAVVSPHVYVRVFARKKNVNLFTIHWRYLPPLCFLH